MDQAIMAEANILTGRLRNRQIGISMKITNKP